MRIKHVTFNMSEDIWETELRVLEEKTVWFGNYASDRMVCSLDVFAFVT